MNQNTERYYEFGSYRLDPLDRVLLRRGKPVPLAPKALDILVVLIQNRGRLVRRDDLMRAVWPGAFVEEANLTVNISVLRKALGQTADGKEYIETVPRRGYRFDAKVKAFTHQPVERLAGAGTPATEPVQPDIRNEERKSQTERSGSLAETEPARQPRKQIGARTAFQIAAAAAALVAIVIIWVHFGPKSKTGRPVSAAVRSVAVLPFKSLRAAPEDEYLGLGLADALITRLGNLRRVIVRPTDTVRKYGVAGQDPAAAGHALAVEAVLDGSIQRIGDRIRVTVQLIRVSDGAPLWGDRFDDKFTDMFAVEDSISQEVAGALTPRLTGEEQQQLTRRHTENSDAYQLYLKGRYFWGKRTVAGVETSVEYFKRAVDADPKYALAYAGLADAYLLLGSSGYSEIRPREAMPKAKAAAAQALAIDDTLAEVHTSLAYVRLIYDWDWPGAEKEFRRALDLNPSNTSARHWYSHYLTAMGRHQESIAEAKRALEINPTDLTLNEHLAWAYLMARQYDLASGQCRRTLDMDPNFALAHRRLGEAYLYETMYPQATAEFQKGLELSGGGVIYKTLLIEAYGLSGRRSDAVQVLKGLEQLSRQKYISPAAIAEAYIGLGEKDEVLNWLQKAYDERSDSLAYLKVDPGWDSLRRDPKFQDLLRRLGLT